MANTPPLMIPAIGADGALYPIEKMAAHRDGTLHQAVSVFVFCGYDLLTQKRALNKYHCGGTWANTCCTHPHWGESLDQAALRRLEEELGFCVPLTRADVITYKAEVTNGLWEHEQVQVYEAHVQKNDIEIVLNYDEVCDFDWIPIGRIMDDAELTPALYAPWFQIYLARWDELGIKF